MTTAKTAWLSYYIWMPEWQKRHERQREYEGWRDLNLFFSLDASDGSDVDYITMKAWGITLVLLYKLADTICVLAFA